MLVRLEPTRNDSISLVIDEIDRFIGEISDIDFGKCMENKDIVEIDDYTYFTVSKEELLKFCKK